MSAHGLTSTILLFVLMTLAVLTGGSWLEGFGKMMR
jgi:hypothetical protein